MLKNPSSKYRAFPAINLPNRQWPSRTITQAPIWMSTDLRDGNQSLFEPMNGARKMQMFKMLCQIGFKEIEVSFPSASQTDFDFVRTLIKEGHIPDDVTIIVLTQAREHLICRTMESLRGAKRAIVHVYNATSQPFRDMVFNMSQREVVEMAVNAVSLIKQLAADQPCTEWQLEYSPETFTATELDFAKEVCDAVTETWGATPSNKVILNLPATVEVATPNVYADQIEWMGRHLARRDSVIISLHPHNDRGTAVAATELGLMAGAERVEGCLFGHGERTGNVDLVTLALNLYSQGIAPNLDFSDIDTVARTVEHCTQLPIHPRHPYVGDLVFTAFSGSHQDAIKKGFSVQQTDGYWNMPYLPIDPADVGRSYDSVIRVNSQSGKGGVAYLLENSYGVVMPRRLQVEFSGVVQQHTDSVGGEISAQQIWQLFSQTYLQNNAPICYREYHLFEHGKNQGIRLVVDIHGVTQVLTGYGNGPIEAAVNALHGAGIYVQVRSYEERSMNADVNGLEHCTAISAFTAHNGVDKRQQCDVISNNRASPINVANAQACTFMEMTQQGVTGACYGVGIDSNMISASVKALVSGVNRTIGQADFKAVG